MNRRIASPESRDPAQLEAELMKAQLRSSLLGTPLDPPRIGRFVLSQWLGQGGSGAVYAAQDPTSGSMVALKLLRKQDAGAVANFKREFRALAHLVHENLVQLYELFGDDHGFYFSMELVHGVRFTQYARDPGRGCDELKLRAALGQLLSGVRALHAAGKLHRDLKPSNVLVTESGRVVVLDFGLLVTQRAEPAADTARSPAGTPDYMAPEVLAGAPPTPASDAYAIGVMLFQALTGLLPFAGVGEGDASAVRARRASSLQPGIDPELDALCAALLEPDPHARASIETALDALQQRAAPARAAHRPEHPVWVGREAELAALHAALDSLVAGAPRAVFVHGPSGIGKSALADRFAGELRGRATLLRGRCHERESLSYKAFDGVIDALAAHLQRLPEEPVAELSARERAALLRIFPSLLPCPQLAADPADAAQLSPQRARLLAFSALKRVLRELARRAPLVLLVDDLQWADLDSARLLLDLLGPPDAPALLYVGCYRDEEAQTAEFLRELSREDGGLELACAHERIALEPLAESAAVAMALGLMQGQGHGQDAEGIGQRIAREAAGVPLLVSELCAYFARELRGDATALSLSELLSRRIATLGALEYRALCLLSLAARPLREELLDRALAEAPAQPRARRILSIENLVKADARGRLVIYHDQLREQIVRLLPAAEAAALHRSLAEAYERAGADEPEWLIEHWRAAGESGRAFEYAVSAAELAARKLAFHRAAALYETALELAPDASPRASELHIALGDVLVNAGRGARAAQHYLRAQVGADEEAAYALRCRAAQHYLRTGQRAEAIALLEQLFRGAGSRYPQSAPEVVLQLLLSRARLALRPRVGAPGPLVERRLQLLRAVFRETAVGDPLRGLLFQSWFSEAAASAGDRESEFLGAAWDIYHRAFLSTARSERVIERRLAALDRMAAELGTPYAEGTAAFVRGQAAMMVGNFALAADRMSHAQRVFRERCLGASWEESTSALVLYMALENVGPLSELCREAPELVRRAQENVDEYSDALLSAYMASALMIEDRGEETVRFLEQRLARLPEALDPQRFGLSLRMIDALLYVGRGQAAFEFTERLWPVYLRSGFDRAQLLSVFTHMRRAHAALVAGAERGDPALVRLAESEAKRIARTQRPYAQIVADTIRGAIAAQRGQRADAERLLRSAFTSTQALHIPVTEHCYRLALGHVVPGTEGVRLRAEAEASLRAQGVVAPRRFARIYVSGLF